MFPHIQGLLAKRPREDGEAWGGQKPSATSGVACALPGSARVVRRALMSIMTFWVMGFASALKQVRAHLSAQPRMVALLLLVSVFRIGVASHPGPDAEFSSFVLGITNPTGVHCQATYVTEHTAYADVWALGETHLGYHDLQYAYSVEVADPSMCRVEHVEQMPADPPPVPEWHGLLPLRPTPLGAIRWYGDSVVSKLIQWLWTAMAVGQGPYMVWNSNVQVYVDYALQTGDVDPIRVRGWPDRAVYSLHALQHLSFKERARWFGKVLRKILRHAGMSVSSTYTAVRPVTWSAFSPGVWLCPGVPSGLMMWIGG